MANTVVFLWISGAALIAPAPGQRALDDLSDFGATRGLSFAAAAPARQADAQALRHQGAAWVDEVESELEAARTALAALEEDAAAARLSAVEKALLDYPDLPQASFLMAECLALQAQAAREHDPALAQRLEARRFALEGPRATAFGDPTILAPKVPSLTLELRGLGDGDELELDGQSQAPHTVRVTLAPGLHHARVWRGGRAIFATFTEVRAEQPALELAVPALVPCSAEDLEAVPRDHAARAAELSPHIACASWAEVRSEVGGIGVSLCEHDRCGSFVHWQRPTPAPFTPIAVERRQLPTWAGFAIAGSAALFASGLLLWQSGAFDHGHATAATWQYGGLNPQAIRF